MFPRGLRLRGVEPFEPSSASGFVITSGCNLLSGTEGLELRGSNASSKMFPRGLRLWGVEPSTASGFVIISGPRSPFSLLDSEFPSSEARKSRTEVGEKASLSLDSRIEMINSTTLENGGLLYRLPSQHFSITWNLF